MLDTRSRQGDQTEEPRGLLLGLGSLVLGSDPSAPDATTSCPSLLKGRVDEKDVGHDIGEEHKIAEAIRRAYRCEVDGL
jgi:hypothetical protein